jgi:DNA-directed RNA polymerase subunit RPC12/RpoP/ActR/RegA family two-component response regulator
MNISCNKCQSKFKIPDEKIPKGQKFSLTCPQCNAKVLVEAQPDPAPSSNGDSISSTTDKSEKDKTIIDEVDADSYDASDKPFDFVEEGVKTALLCEPDATLQKKTKTALYNMDYHITAPQLPKDALKQMRFHVFDMVVLNERFGTQNPEMNPVLNYLNRLNMSIRRNIFVTLITDRFRTMDNMAAFNRSVNMIVNPKNIDEIEKILRRGMSDHEAFYRVYKRALLKTGRV